MKKLRVITPDGSIYLSELSIKMVAAFSRFHEGDSVLVDVLSPGWPIGTLFQDVSESSN